MKLIAITGNAGSGKTTISNILREKGYFVIDADKVVHKLLESQEIKNFIKQTFGEEFLDRKKLSDYLFKNPEKMDIYESFIRQKVIKAINEEILKSNSEIIFIDAALVFEYGLEYMFDKIICVIADEKKLIERLKNKGYSEDTARMILLRQMPQNEKAKRSHIIIENNGTIEELKEKVLKLLLNLV
jgi:dephospho-CoA kinase